MKKLFKSVLALAIMGLALVSCNKADEAIPQDPEKGYVYTFSVVDDYAPTKATLGTNGVGWESGDRVGLFTPNSHGYANIDVSKTPKEVILYSKEIIPAGSKAYAYYPYSSDNTKDDDEAAKIVFPDVQQGTSVSAMPMAGIPFTVETEVAAKTNQNGVIKFLNLGSIIEFNIFSSKAEYQTETVKSILVKTTGDDYVSGNTYLDLTQVDASDESSLSVIFLQASDAKNEVKVNQDAQVADSKNNATPVYMVLVPGNHSGLIIVNTDQASYTWNLPSVAFKRNGLKHFNMDLNNATRGPLNEVVKTLPYEEPFTSSFGDFTINDVTLSGLSSVWTMDSHGCAKATGYSGSSHETESWLVSPWIDLTGGVQYAAITFDHVYRYVSDHAGLSFMLMTDDPTAAWQELTVPTWVTNNNWTFESSGEISLNSFVGKKVKVAFKYTSTATSGATWEVKNFKAFVASAPKTANPVISYEASTKTVTITCETPGAKIGYTTDGTNPDADDSGPKGTTQLYTGPFTISKTTTVKAFAGADEMDPSDIVSKECVVGYEFETIAELNALAQAAGTNSVSKFGKLTNAVVSFTPSTDAKAAIITDGTGSIMVYKENHGLSQGQTFTGDLTATVTTYKNYYTEITDLDAAFTGSGAVVEPTVLTLAQLSGNYTKYQNTYAKVENLNVTSVNGRNIYVSDGTNTYVVYANYDNPTAVAGDKVTAVGTITKYNTTEELKVWTSSDLTVSHTATTHKITYTQPSEGGTIYVGYASNFSNQINSGDEVMEGTVITIEATAATNFNFNGWTLTGATPQDASKATTSFTVGSSDVNIAASFLAKGAPVTIIVDGSTLTSTATTSNTEHTFGGVTFVFSDGAKQYSSLGDHKFSDKAILIGKSGKYIYNKTAIPGKITKFEIYANKGASAKVTVGVNFSSSAITAYNSSAANTYESLLSTLDCIYDASAKIPDNCKYFWYQVTNANNSQVQFRITYIPD